MPPRKAASPDLPTYDKRVFRLSKADIKVKAARGEDKGGRAQFLRPHECCRRTQADFQEIERLLAEQQLQLGVAHATRSRGR